MEAQNNWIRFRWVMTVLCLVAAVFSLGAGTVLGAGTEYYVDINNGKDNPYPTNGTEGAPWRTLHYAFGAVPAGTAGTPTVLHVMPGQYNANSEGELGTPIETVLEVTTSHIHVKGECWPEIVYIDVGNDWTNGIEVRAEGIIIEGVKITGFSNNGIMSENFRPVIQRNIISNVSNYGIWISSLSDPINPNIYNNLIYGCQTGGIFLAGNDNGGVPEIYHNTIDAGYYPSATGISIDDTPPAPPGVPSPITPLIKYNIISNFSSGMGLNNTGGNPQVDYNCFYNNNINCQGWDCTGGNNIFPTFPATMYIDSSLGNYQLSFGYDPGGRTLSPSPCIDAIPGGIGNPLDHDLFENSRPEDINGIDNGGVYDMGAFEKRDDADGDGLTYQQESTYTPNPPDPTIVPLDPGNSDTDDDGYHDGEEIARGTDPNNRNLKPVYPPANPYNSDSGDPKYYVDSNQTWLGLGTEAEPWQTLHMAVHHINNGIEGTESTKYELNVAAGIYSADCCKGREPEAPLEITQDYITIIGAGKDATIIDGTSCDSYGDGGWIDGFKIRNAQYVTIRDLTIRNFEKGELGGSGVCMEGAKYCVVASCRIHGNSSSGVNIGPDYYTLPPVLSEFNAVKDSCEIFHNGQAGVHIYGECSDIKIQNGCDISRNGLAGIHATDSSNIEIANNAASISDNGNASSSDGAGTGIYVDNCTGVNIHHNRILWSKDDANKQPFGIYMVNCYDTGAGDYNLISDNEIYNHHVGEGACGILLKDSQVYTDRNILFDNFTGIYVWSSASDTAGPRNVWNNLIYNGPEDIANTGIMITFESTGGAGYITPTFYHNTIDGMKENAIYVTFTNEFMHGPLIQFNNLTRYVGAGIFNEGLSQQLSIIRYNNVWSEVTDSVDYINCSGEAANSISKNPLYVFGISGYDYHLQPASPCIDTIPEGLASYPDDVNGDLDLNLRPQPYPDGNNDMGCYEAALSTYTISGTVTVDGGGVLEGVVMSGLPGNPETDTSGFYTGTVPYNWSGTVTPTKAGYTFNPVNRVYNNVISDQPGQNCTALQIAASEYYVDSAGGDDANNDGLSWATAWQTLHYAIDQINGGEPGTALTPYTLYLKQGGYVDGDVFALPPIGVEPDAPLYITQHYLSIVGQGSGAVIDGTGASFGGWKDGLDIQSAKNIVIQNVGIQNFNANGIYMGSAVDGIVNACRIHNNGANGIAIAYGMGQLPVQSSGNMIHNGCEIYENGDAGIYIFNGTGNQVVNNIGSIYDNGTGSEPGYGIVIWSDPDYESSGHTASNNLVENNTISWTGGSTYIQGTGIYSRGPGYGASPNNELIYNYISLHPESGIEIYNTSVRAKRNTLVDNNVGVRIEAKGSGLRAGGAFWNNLIYDDAGTLDFLMTYGFTMVAANGGNINYPTLYHNTIHGGTADGINIDITGGTSSPVPGIFANIITGFDGFGIYYAGTGSVSLDDMSYNNVWDNTSGPYSGCGPGANDLYLDPLYINSGGGNFHLDPEYSPCVDQITSGISPVCADLDHPDATPCWRPQPAGGNWDMGCYETALDLTHTVEFIAGSGGTITGTTTQAVAHGGGTTAVTASPFSGYEFAGWTGDYVGTTNPLTITNVTSNKTVYANFRRISVVTAWVVRFEAGNGGRVDGDTVQVINNGSSTRSVEAVPNAGYAFDRWTGSYNGTANPLILNNVTSNMTITANFRRVPPVETHTVNFIAGAGGSISGSTAQVVAHGGSTSAVTAVPDPSHEFAGWSGDSTATTESLTITNVTFNMTIYANFRRIEVTTYTVNFIANAGGRIVGNTTQTVEEGGVCAPVTAVADEGFEFIGWSGDADGTNATLTVTNVTANMIIYADFQEQEPVTYTVMFNAGTGGHISGETAQVVEEGKDLAPVTAVADPGYTFAGWSGDAGGTNATLTVTNVISDMSITALFDKNAGNHPPEKPLPVGPSEDGVVPPGPVTLRSGLYADPENDPHTRTWWQVTRFGSSDIVYEIQTESDLTSHTVSGLMPGVKYAWRAGYQDAGSGEYTWSDMGVFVVGTPSVDENIPPVDPGTRIGDYRMVSFVSWPVPSSAASVFGPLLPEGYDPALLRIGTYDPVLGGYREYPDFSVEPGRSYWFLAREGLDLSVEGIPVSTGVDFCVSLGFNRANGDGWNMIAPPNPRHYALGDLVVTATDGAGDTVFGPMPVALLTPDNPYLDIRIWSWVAGDYVASDDPEFVLEAYSGYWVRAKRANVTLCFPADAPVALRSFGSGDDAGSLLDRFSTWLAGILPDIDTAHADASHDKPPMPMSALEDRAGGSKGCFIEAIETEGN